MKTISIELKQEQNIMISSVKFLSFFIFIFSLTNSYNKDFEYLSVPNNLVNFDSVKINAFEFRDITDYLPRGYSMKGDVDYTSFIQNALDNESKILMPNFPILVNAKGLSIHSNTSILFQLKSKIIMQPNDKTNYGIINIINKSDVNIYNARITGDRYKHLNDKGEWGMGINLIDSKNINIINPIITQCWGDGIYIGTRGKLPENITISGGLVDDNRRNGISIISGENITVKNMVLANTNGTLPMAGIDLEPNKNNESLLNIELSNIISYNNAEDGFLIYLFKLISENSPAVSINITNCKDYYSTNAISIPGLRNDYNQSYRPVRGKIIFEDFKSYDSKFSFKESSGNYIFTPKILFNSFHVFKNNEQDLKEEKKIVQWMKSKKMNIN